jgi:hypothetical protein
MVYLDWMNYLPIPNGFKTCALGVSAVHEALDMINPFRPFNDNQLDEHSLSCLAMYHLTILSEKGPKGSARRSRSDHEKIGVHCRTHLGQVLKLHN